MIQYYEITKNIHEYLDTHNDINSTLVGVNISNIDTLKQTIFPLGHVLVNSVQPYQDTTGAATFSVTVSVMDILDLNNDELDKGNFKGNDNKQDILNTMLEVLMGLNREIMKGDMSELGYDLVSRSSFEPFEDRFENLLVGWTGTFTIDAPNRT